MRLMSIFTSRPLLRWVVPAAALFVVAGTGLVAGRAAADDRLPARTAEQLLVAVQKAEIDGLSGTVVQEANLGIPEIPGTGSGSRSSEFNSLISGSHTLRVWYSGPDKARVALLGTLGESDLIANGSDLWVWSSEKNEATHRTITPGDKPTPDRTPPADTPKTPQEAAQRVLAEIGPTTEVFTDSDVTVARRAAYELVLKPKDRRSLISSVRVAVDGETSVPLRVRVYGTDEAQPAFSVGFESVDFSRPDDQQFAFNPPPGAKVTEAEPPTKAEIDAAEEKARKAREQAEKGSTVVGSGWTTVWLGTADVDTRSSGSDPSGDQLEGLLNQLPRESGAWGSGRVLRGTAFSAVLTDDQRIAVGAVSPELLFEALAR